MWIPVLAAALLTSSLPAQIKILAIENAASYMPGLPEPGSVATVFCTGLSGIQGVITPSSQFPFPQQLAGVGASINGGPAPILAVADAGTYQQINIHVPPERILKEAATVSVNQAGLSVSIPGVSYPPTAGLFADAQGAAVAVRVADGTSISPQNPAHAGEMIAVYGTGFGATYPPKPVGFPAPVAPVFAGPNDFVTSNTTTNVAGPARQLILGQTATSVSMVSLVPGLAGVDQAAFQIPLGQAPGVTTLKVVSGSFVCQPPPFATSCTFQANAASNTVNLPIR